jgi:hypothetical protein
LFKYLINNFNAKREAKIKIDIAPNFLKEKYCENFNSISQSINSKVLEDKMKKVVSEYVVIVKNSSVKYCVHESVIESILKDLKNNKKPGKNGVSNEMLKYSRNTPVTSIIANLLESMINGGYCPDNINIGYITTIIKDASGCHRDFNNTRPITISETISMILEELIMRDILNKAELNKHQFGFTKFSSCAHAVFSMKEIALDARNQKKNAIALFLDFSKAFDKVNRVKLWYRLINITSPKYWLLLKNYYEKMKLYVIDNNGSYTDPFGTSVGVKQGGKLSPFLNNILVNNLLNIIENSNLTYKIKNKNKGLLVYADDTNVICESLAEMRLVIRLIENFCSDYDITINVKKTKWMRLAPNYSIYNGSLQIGGLLVEEVKSFKFLGVNITSNGSHSEHYNNRRKLFFKGISEINNLGFSNKDTNTKVISVLYTTFARSRLAYGFETISLKNNEIKTNLSKLESNQIKKACGLSIFSKSKLLIYALGLSPIEAALKKRKISFLKQLCNNKATADLIISGNHETLKDIYEFLGINYKKDIVLGEDAYLHEISRKCWLKLKEIKQTENRIKKTELVRCIKYLLNNRNFNNDDTLQYLLDPRRFKQNKIKIKIK